MAESPETIERRRVPRRLPDSCETLARVRLRGGRELVVTNISPGGALLEGEGRLLPGTHVDVHVTTRHGRVLVRARVVRASVWRLCADSVCYHSALAFDAFVDTSAHGYAVPGESEVVGAERTAYPGLAGEALNAR